jgi:hypothetical protein
MKYTKASIQLLLAAAMMISCSKEPVNRHYLQFSNATINVLNRQGSRAAVQVRSDLAWQLTIETPAPGWMVMDKFAGTGCDSLIITATQDNNTHGYKYANVIATAINDSSIAPVRLTIVQYDSTYKAPK